jgi:uncharacterized protein (TIGR02145 family)
MLEAAKRSSVLNANISSGNMGDNIRNDIQWRKEWVARLTETERFFDSFNKTERMPYTLYYSKDIEQGKIDYQNETVTMSIGTVLLGSTVWQVSIGRALQAVYDGLNATKKKDDWGLGKWPQQGVTDLKAFAKQSSSFSVVFELVNNRNKVIGRQTLQEGGWWGLSSGRPSIEMFEVKRKTLSFQSVNANDITDNLAIRIASVNGKDAGAASMGGVLQIKVMEPDVSFFSDSRDGQKYRKAKIGEQVWMAENLNYKTGNSKCYGNSDSNCKKYGRLYDWATAMKACPKGWHLPSDAEWGIMSGFIGGASIEGRHLKAKTGWKDNGNGRDTYGFAALPGGNGYSDGSFYDVGNYGYWWSASEYNSNIAYYRDMYYNNEGAIYNGNYKSYLFSVRCAQD